MYYAPKRLLHTTVFNSTGINIHVSREFFQLGLDIRLYIP